MVGLLRSLVALLAEGVDRNYLGDKLYRVTRTVALLAEGVDRNKIKSSAGSAQTVALLAEGVDRNCQKPERCRLEVVSPSSRRAWIEIDYAPAF